MSDATTDVGIQDVPDEERFEIREGDRLVGFVQYRRRKGLIGFFHTEIGDEFEGHGYGRRLIRAALGAARNEGSPVLPFCPFVNEYIVRHPEYVDLVPEAQRDHFGL